MTHVDDLENLRKRAKELVRQHRAGMHTVAQRIRLALPRFDGMRDADVLAAEFKLHDAQELLAREHGFATWAELKEAPPVTTSTDTGIAVQRAFAQVFVRDVTASLAWYRDVLGFDVDFAYGEPPFYAQVSRDGVAFNLRHTDQTPWRDHREENLLSVRLDVSDCKALYGELKGRGADVVQPPRLEPWGQVTMLVADPDGNLIGFGSEQ